MWYIVQEILMCLGLAALIGGVVGWLLKQFLGSSQLVDMESSWRMRYDEVNGQIGGLKSSLTAEQGKFATAAQNILGLEGKLKDATASIGTLETDLLSWKDRVPKLDAELAAKAGALTIALADYAKCQETSAALSADLKARDAGIVGLRDEIEKLKRDLVVRAESEKTLSARVGELQPLVPKLRDAEVRLTALSAEKDGEISKHLAQIALLAPLAAQVADLSGKLKSWESRYNDLMKERDVEAAKLGARIKELEPYPGQLADREAKLRDGESRYKTVVESKDAEIAKLIARIKELEVFPAQVSDREARLKAKDEYVAKLEARIRELEGVHAEAAKKYTAQISEWEGKYTSSLRANDDEIGKLSVRMQELAPLAGQVQDWEGRFHTAVKSKDDEIGRLNARIKELEVLRAQLAERDSSLKDWEGRYALVIKEWEGKYAAGLKAKDDELGGLHARIKDGESRYHLTLQEWEAKFATGLKAKEDELVTLRAKTKEWETKYSTGLKTKDDEIGKLTIAVKELEPMKAQLTDRDRIIRDWDTRYNSTVKDWEGRYNKTVTAKDADIAKYKAKIQDCEPLPGQIKERDRIIKEWDARYASMAKGKDAEIAKWTARFAEYEPLPALVKERDKTIKEWDVRYSTEIRTRDGEIAKLHTRVTQLEPLTAQVRESDGRLKEQDGQIASLRQSLTRYEGDLNACGQKVAELEEKLKKPVKPEIPMDRKDNLVDVYGVGPVLAKELNSHGVYLFQQIAEWTEADIDKFGSLLPHQFNDRIRREDWIGSSKTEHFKKYGEKL